MSSTPHSIECKFVHLSRDVGSRGLKLSSLLIAYAAARVSRARIMISMALRLGSDPELSAVVERARRRAQEAGELQLVGAPPFESPLDPAAREIVVSWIRDGGYDRAVAEVVADDPDLATQ